MHVIKVRNVHQALPEGLYQLGMYGIHRDSRAGPVTAFPFPVTTVYERPVERVIFWPQRNANPFFHLFESLWMLAGRRDVAYVGKLVKRMYEFSDDGETLHGAYGHRWRVHFEMDQLRTVIDQLRENPDDRRCVVQMWDARVDLGRQGKDVPCNTQIMFSRFNQGQTLDMTVCNRSNDLIWGAYGANAVHFSMLQEYVAAGIGCPVGRYYQVSNNLHAYVDLFDKLTLLANEANRVITGGNWQPYETLSVKPLVDTDLKTWDRDLALFMDYPESNGFENLFFRRVVKPMWMAYKAWQRRDLTAALEIVDQGAEVDWKKAAVEWLERKKS